VKIDPPFAGFSDRDRQITRTVRGSQRTVDENDRNLDRTQGNFVKNHDRFVQFTSRDAENARNFVPRDSCFVPIHPSFMRTDDRFDRFTGREAQNDRTDRGFQRNDLPIQPRLDQISPTFIAVVDRLASLTQMGAQDSQRVV